MTENEKTGVVSCNMEERKLPVGIQSFEKLREEGCLYIDKTAYIYELTRQISPYFLSRPRRFGKSLLLSTMRAYFEGRRDLFEGLAITELTKDDPEAFVERPVFYIDFNGEDYSDTETQGETTQAEASGPEEKGSVHMGIEARLEGHLRRWEAIYGADPENRTLASRFEYVIRTAHTKAGKKVVILVDEYDKPLLESDPDLDRHNRAVFKGFFSVLKSCDEFIKFIFITGVTKFSKVSIFSDINQLRDISLSERYAGICGVTEQELMETFTPEIEALARRRKLTVEGCLAKLKKQYDGYHFSEESEGVYNPYSLLNAFSDLRFGSYWFETGTPTFLINKLKETKFDPKEFTSGEITMEPKDLLDYKSDNPNPVPLFYQSGYLTITGYDERFGAYSLNYPNDEVRYGFLGSLAPMLLHKEREANPLDIRSFVRDIESGDTDSLRDRFTALYSSIPYPEGTDADNVLERDFQNVAYITFMLLGQYVKAEVHNATGRADAVVETDDFVYLFEFKRDRTAEEALRQIEDKGYALPYSADKRKIIKIGVNFNSEKRTLDGWMVARD